MLKNAYFYGKKCKNWLSAPEPPLAPGGWELRPQTPALLLLPNVTTLSGSFLALSAFYYEQKEKNNYSTSAFAFLHLFFTSNSVVFVNGGRKNVSCPRAQGTLATPLVLIPFRNLLSNVKKL